MHAGMDGITGKMVIAMVTGITEKAMKAGAKATAVIERNQSRGLSGNRQPPEHCYTHGHIIAYFKSACMESAMEVSIR